MVISTLDEDGVEVISLKETDREAPVYNLTVSDAHTFYVGNDGIWVHNTDCVWDDIPENARPTGKKASSNSERELVEFEDSNGNVRQAYQGADGKYYDAGNPRGLLGKEYEGFLQDNLPGGREFRGDGNNGSVKADGTSKEFDGAYDDPDRGEVLFEAKSGGFWQNADLDKFKSDTGRGQRVADFLDRPYEIISNTPIPDSIKSWLAGRGISFREI